MSQRARWAVIAAAAVVIVVGFVIAGSGGDNTSSKSGSTAATSKARQGPGVTVPTKIVVKGGKPVGGIQEISVSKGDEVRFTVNSDVADEIHVHGYDFMKHVKAGGQVAFDFKAKIDGAFEIELEGRKEQIAELKVEP
jgi:plastocyanin